MVGFEEPAVPVVADYWTGTLGSANVVGGTTTQLNREELEFRTTVMDWAEAMGISDDVAVHYLRRLIRIYDQRRLEIVARR